MVLLSDAGGTLTTTGLSIPEGQTVSGGHRGVVLSSSDGSVRTVLQAGSDTPVVKGTANIPTFQLATGSGNQIIRGLEITGRGDAIQGDTNHNVRLENLELDNSSLGEHGIHARRPQGEWILKDLSVRPGARGINVEEGTADLKLKGVTVRESNGSGIDARNMSSGSVRLKDVLVDEADGFGVIVSNVPSGSFENLRVENSNSNGIRLSYMDSVSGDSIVVKEPGSTALMLERTDNVTIGNLELLDVGAVRGGTGLDISESDSVTITDFLVDGVKGSFEDGVFLNGLTNDLSNYTFQGTIRDVSASPGDIFEITNAGTFDGISGTIEHDGSATPCNLSSVTDVVNSTITLVNSGTGDVWELDNATDSCVMNP